MVSWGLASSQSHGDAGSAALTPLACRSLPAVAIEVPYLPLSGDQSDVRYFHGPDSEVQPGVPVP
jgi:hypothetical protein